MIRLIKDGLFNIDISQYEYTEVQQSHWFTNKLMTKFSFPFVLPIDIDPFFEQFNSHYLEEYDNFIELLLEKDGEIHEASLEIERVQGKFLKVILRHGYEEFPGFNRKLSELELEQLTVSDIRAHATAKLPLNYPATNYNFPVVHFPFYNKDSVVWKNYTHFINLRYLTTGWVENSVDTQNNIYYNKTIIQPLPHLLHVLSQAFAIDGRVLKGDIITDPEFSKSYIFSTQKLAINDRQETIFITVSVADRQWEGGGINPAASWRVEQEILLHGNFRIKGSFKSYRDNHKVFKLNGTTIYYYENDANGWVNFDFEITTTQGADILVFDMRDHNTNDDVAHIEIIPLEIFDENGQEINYLAENNTINLNNNVPDMTVGKLFEICRKWKNLELTVKGNEVWINYVEKELERSEVIDFRKYEVKYPSKKTLKDKSWLLKFNDVNNEEHSFQNMFIDKSGVYSENYEKTDQTQEIEIDAIPLPKEFNKNEYSGENILANDCFIDNETKLMLVMFEGHSNINIGENNTNLLLPSIYDNHYKSWFSFLLRAKEFTWVIRGYVADLFKLKSNSKLYCYGREHVVKKLNRTRITPNSEEIEIETIS